MSDKDDLIYDEEDSVAFIQNYLPQELKGKFSNDDHKCPLKSGRLKIE